MKKIFDNDRGKYYNCIALKEKIVCLLIPKPGALCSMIVK